MTTLHSPKKKAMSLLLAVLMLLSTAAPAFADVFAFVTVEEEQAPVYGAGVLTADLDGYTVTVGYDEAAQIPDGAELFLYEYVEGTLQYDEYKAAAEASVLGEDEETVFARFFDITISYTDPATGETVKVEPAAPVAVEIQSAQLTEAEKVSVVHFPESEASSEEPVGLVEEAIQDVFGKEVLKANKGALKVGLAAELTVEEDTPVADLPTVEENGVETPAMEVLETETVGEGIVAFTADGFSVYGIMGTNVITTRYITAEGESYIISVEYGPEANIPNDAELAVEEIDGETAEYEIYRNTIKSSLAFDEDISFARFFDISILSDGYEVEPEAPVYVSIALEKELNEDIRTVHFADEVEYIENDFDNEGNVRFEANSFSVYGVILIETITGDIITESGQTCTVTVSYSAEANIPEDSKLKLDELSKDSEDYQRALDAIIVEAEKLYNNEITSDEEIEPFDAEAYKESVGLDVLDISILDKEGNKVEPSAPVKVTIERKNLPDDINAEAFRNIAEIQHLNESTETPFLETVATAGSETAGDITVTDGAVKAEFETGSFSLYTVRWSNKSITVHFVDRDGNELTGITDANGNSVDGSSITISGGGSLDLSTYKKDGYTYANTRITGYGDTGLIIYPEFRANSNGNNLRYWGDGTNNPGQSGNGSDRQEFQNGANVYVIMDPVPSTSGSGSGSGGDSTIADLPDPETSKTLTDNHDGTYDLNLSITGKSDSKQENKNINILFVIDNSSSMDEGAGTGHTRLYETKEAVVDAAKELLKNNTTAAPKLVELAAIDFDRDENNVISWTSSETEFTTAINGITAGNGTNWEDGLLGALNYGTGDGDPTYVIFFTDGMPYGYRGNNHVYEGSSNLPAMMASKDEARAIVNSKRTLYNIFAYGSTSDYNADYLGQLTDYAYNDSSKRSTYYKSAASSDDVVKALAEIVDSITQKAGFEKVKITDGITGLTQSTVIHGQAGAFTYYRSGGKNADGTEKYDSTANEGKGEEWTNAPPASYAAATGVTWDLTSIGQLEDGVTYTVSFTVWPDQDAYDTVAEINNTADPKASYDALDSTVKTQILFDEETGTCSLKTNTEAKAEYTTVKTSTEKKLSSGATQDGSTWKYTDSSGNVWTYVQNADGTYTGTTTKDKSLTYDDVPSISLDKTTMKVKKVWVDGLTSAEDRPESIDFTIYEDGVKYKTVTLTGDGDVWEAEINIAPGIYVTPGTHGTASTGDASGVLEGSEGHVYTILETSAENHYDFSTTPVKPMLNGTTTTDGDMIEYLTKTAWSSSEAALTATNTVKDGIYIYKKVTTDGTDEIDCDEQFTFKITLKDDEGNPVYTSGQGVSGDLAWRIDKADATSASGYKEDSRGYYTSTDGTVTLKMDASGRIRIVNVPVGTMFTVEEVTTAGSMPNGYEHYNTKVNDIISTDNKAEGKTVGNTQWTVTVTNKRNDLLVKLLKVDNTDESIKLEGAQFSLFKSDSVTPATDADGNPIGTIISGQDGLGIIGTLLAGTYILKETKAPDGYNMLTANISIVVTNNNVSALYGTSPCNVLKSEDGLTYTIKITNSSGVELPSTGFDHPVAYTIAGLAMVGAVGAVLHHRKKDEEEYYA